MSNCNKMLTLSAIAISIALGYIAATNGFSLHRAAHADQAATVAAAEEKQNLTADQAWQRLKAGNNRFADEMMEKQDLGAKKRQELAKGQKPFAVVLTCADSRLTPEFIFDRGWETFSFCE